MKNNKLRDLKLDYSWIMIALCFLSVFICFGFCSSNRMMYLTAITDALHIKRGAFSLNDTLRFAAQTILNLFFGTLVSKFGTKKLLCAGYFCMIGFAVINAYADSLYQFYIAGVLLGIGLSLSGTTMMSTVINKWCTKNKGTITGAVLAANGLGGAVAAQIVSPMIFEPGNPFGYRNSYKLIALLLMVILVLILLFFRNAPKGADSTAAPTQKKKKVRGAGWVGMDYSDAAKKPYLYFALVCMFFTGMSLQGLAGIATPHMYDIGLDKPFVATVSTFSSLCILGSKFLTGYLYDNVGMKRTMNLSFICAFISIAALLLLTNTPVGRVIAFVRSLTGAIALPLETVMLPLFASELFGNKSFDKTVGLFCSASTAGFAVGAPFANLCYDRFGSYDLPFIIFSALMIFVTVTMQFVLRSAGRDKKAILSAAENAAAN